MISMVGLAHIAGGGILPSPTSDLNVSGMILEIGRHQLGSLDMFVREDLQDDWDDNDACGDRQKPKDGPPSEGVREYTA